MEFQLLQDAMKVSGIKCKAGGDKMNYFSEELNYDIMLENYIKDLQELLMEFDEESLVLTDRGKGMFTLECITHRVCVRV